MVGVEGQSNRPVLCRPTLPATCRWSCVRNKKAPAAIDSRRRDRSGPPMRPVAWRQGRDEPSREEKRCRGADTPRAEKGNVERPGKKGAARPPAHEQGGERELWAAGGIGLSEPYWLGRGVNPFHSQLTIRRSNHPPRHRWTGKPFTFTPRHDRSSGYRKQFRHFLVALGCNPIR